MPYRLHSRLLNKIGMSLRGIKVVEMMGLAPGPFLGTMLADFGASVTVVQRADPNNFQGSLDVMSNGKKILPVDLKTQEGLKIMNKLCATSDVFLDTFRPGVMEKIGLSPELLLKNNSRLIYARLTGYGQNGYYKHKAGHDINYIAMSGILALLSKNKEPPVPPLNLIADFAGGSQMCLVGILLALFEREQSGKGQVIDCSMTEGAAYLGTWLFKSRNLPIWSGEPGTNLLDGGVPYYRTYKTKDGKFMAVGALEPQFYLNFLKGLGLTGDEYDQFYDVEICKKKFQDIFLTKTQEQWCEVFDKLDACVTPVLDFEFVDKHECNHSRKSFFRSIDNMVIPEPAPKLSRTPGNSVSKGPKTKAGQHTIQILKDLGYEHGEIDKLIEKGIVYVSKKSNL